MSQGAQAVVSAGPVAMPVGVRACVRMGWDFLASDFKHAWLVGLMAALLMWVAACTTVFAVLLIPPLLAGLFLAVRRGIDGGRLEIGSIFSGFRERYWPAVVSMLPLSAAVVLLVIFIAIVSAPLWGWVLLDAVDKGPVAVLIAPISILQRIVTGNLAMIMSLGLLVIATPPLVLVLWLISLPLTFAMAAVWDHPESAYAGARASFRLFKAHFWQTAAFSLIFLGLQLAAWILGQFTFGLGELAAGPLVVFWQVTSTIYLYRAWTGQPLVQVPPEGRTA